MAITVKISLSSGTADNTVVFAETSAGHFTEAIASETAVSVTSSDKPLRAAAVSTVTMPDPVFWSHPGYDFAGRSTSAGAASATYAVGDSADDLYFVRSENSGEVAS